MPDLKSQSVIWSKGIEDSQEFGETKDNLKYFAYESPEDKTKVRNDCSEIRYLY